MFAAVDAAVAVAAGATTAAPAAAAAANPTSHRIRCEPGSPNQGVETSSSLGSSGFLRDQGDRSAVVVAAVAAVAAVAVAAVVAVVAVVVVVVVVAAAEWTAAAWKVVGGTQPYES